MSPDDVATTLVELFARRAAEGGERTAVLARRGEHFAPVTWNELAHDVRRLASALRTLGVQPGDRVVQVAENRYEWIVCDLAILMAQAVHVPIHAALAGPQVAWQIADCEARLVMISTAGQLSKLAPVAHQLPEDALLVTQDDYRPSTGMNLAGNYAQLLEAAPEDAAHRVQSEALGKLTGGDLATIIYTSGTTAQPKGVMLSHANLVRNCQATLEAVGQAEDDVRLSILPWSHIYARTCDLYAWIASGTVLAIAEGRAHVLANCAELKPTLLIGVPYFFEKVYRALAEHGAIDTPGSLRAMLGGHVNLCCSGGAALPAHVAELFQKQGIMLLQGYGLTETSPVISTCTPDANKIDTVGRPLKGVQVRIADDGEILTRGPHVMVGYYKDAEATAATIRDGWLHTGDLGALDEEGYLTITGRKKEILVLSTGKNVAPVALEGLLTRDPLILQALVVGDGRSYLAALIVPDPDALRAAIIQHKIPVTSKDQALVHPGVVELYQKRVEKQLAAVSAAEQVRSFRLLDRGFTIESGELTPTLKLQRNVITANFSDVIRQLYANEPL